MLSSQRHLFDLPEEVTYLNNAYMAPNLKSVEAAGVAGISQKNRPYLVKPADFFDPAERLRASIARLIHAAEPKRVVLTPSVSYGMAVVAQNLPLEAGDNIIIATEQFPSNVYPWMRLCEERGAHLRLIGPPKPEDQNQSWSNTLLEAINSRTRLVSTGHIHWADGTLFDLKAIRQRTREVGAWLSIDGTQSVGALPFSVAEIEPDALVCGGYKWLLGPYSLGMAYFGPALDAGKPVEENWINRLNSEDFAGLVKYQPAYQPGALRYEVGEHSNFVLLPMLQAAIDQLGEWGPAGIQEYCRHLSHEPVQELIAKGVQIAPESQRASHLFGFRLPPHAPKEAIKARFEANQVYVSFRGEAIRVSCHLYNDARDFAKLIDCLEL